MAKLKLLSTIFSKLGTLSKDEGQVIVSRDSKSLYVDLEGERIEITDWIDVDTEEKLLAILSPLINKYYYTKDSNKIWRYINSEWKCLNTSVNDLTPIYTESSTLVKLSSGEKLSVAFGKISKAITDLISHIGDSVKHITSAERTKWNSAKTHADSTHARTDATKVEKSSTNGNIKINGTETTVYTHPSGTNPHGTTKSDVGLGNVGNFKAVSTVSNQGLSDTEKSNARSNIGAQVAGSYASSTHNHDDKYQSKGSYASASHTHDDRYYTESEINTKLNGKANSSHTHTKSQITDFPTSMPASDVYAWAKASSKPRYTKSEVGLGNVDNTADANKSVKYATSAGSAPANGGTATSSNYVNVNNTEAKNVGRLQYFQKSGDDTIMPSKDWYSLIRCQHPGYANGYWQDIAFPFVGGGRPQVRQNVNGTKSAWKELAYKSDIPTTLPANGGNSLTVNGHTVNSDVPANAKFTDTDTWRPLGTTADTACAGNDSRLSNARPASDVYAWAKASSKPSYSWSEITSKPSSFTPASHTHNYAGSSSAGGSANSSLVLTKNSSFNDASTGRVSYYDANITNTTNNASWSAPSSGWHQIYHNDLSVANYWTELAFPVNDANGLAWRQRRAGSYYGWYRILDSNNYKSYCTPANIGAAASSHTHSYAGASSSGGSATSAVKLDSSAGSATQPVYFSGGKPVACSYTLGKSVPSNAVFTDTNTWRGIQNNLTSDSTTDSLSAAQGKVLKGLVDGKADIECNTIGENHSVTGNIQVTSTSTTYKVARLNIANVFSDSAKIGTYLINLEMYINANGNPQFSYEINGTYSDILCTISDIGTGTSSNHRRVTLIVQSARQDISCEIIVKGKFTATKGPTMYATINAIRIGNY